MIANCIESFNSISIVLKQADKVQWNLFVLLIKHGKYHNMPTIITYNDIQHANEYAASHRIIGTKY